MEVKRTYTIQENGQVTLPAEWREKYGLKKGDFIVFKETEDGLLVSPRETQALKLMDEIQETLKKRGITLEEFIESGREERQKIYDKKYARK